MKVRRKSKNDNAISVDQNFARLLALKQSGNDKKSTRFVYEFTWNIDTIAVVRNDIKSLRISLRHSPTTNEISPWNIQDSKSHMTSDDILDGIKMMSSTAKDTKLGNAFSVFKSVIVPVTTKLQPNDAAKVRMSDDDDIATTYLPDQKILSTKTVDVIKKTNVMTPVLKIVTSVPSIAGVVMPKQQAGFNGGNLQAAALDLIFENAIDPSDVIGTNVGIISTQASLAGTSIVEGDLSLKTSSKHTSLTAKKLSPFSNMFLKSTLLSSSAMTADDIEIPVVSTVKRKYINSSKSLVVSAQELGAAESFYVRFELIDVEKNVVGLVDKIVKHRRILDRFETPRQQPIVKASPNQIPGRNTIEVQQYDEQAKSVKMYRRNITRMSNINNPVTMAYTYAGEIPVSKEGGLVKITDVVNNSSTLTYRFVSVGRSGQLGSSFSNIVIPGTGRKFSRRKCNRHAAISVTPNGRYADIRVTNMTKGPVAIGIQRKNCTLNESSYQYVTDRPVVLTDNSESVKFIDKDVKEGSIYEYGIVFFLEDGSVDRSSAYAMYEHMNQEFKGIQIITSDPEIKNVTTKSSTPSQYDIQFSIRSQIDDADFDQLRSALTRQGLASLFDSEINDDRAALNKLIAHHVQRINTADGSLDDYGVISTSLFSDIDAGRTHAVKSVVAGTTYRYLITTLLRAPETLFDEYEKTVNSKQRIIPTVVDTVTGLTNNQYSFKPSKFLHPYTLNHGTLTTKVSRQQLHAKDEFMYGIIGNTKIIDVVVPATDIKLTRMRVERFDSVTNILRWDIIGDATLIDYFIITLNHLGTEQIIGRAHALNNSSTYEFIHDLTNVDMGTCTYRVTTMLTNFLMGSSIESDRIVI